MCAEQLELRKVEARNLRPQGTIGHDQTVALSPVEGTTRHLIDVTVRVKPPARDVASEGQANEYKRLL